MTEFLLGAKTAGTFALKHWRLAVIAGLVLYIVILKLSLAGEQRHNVKLSRRLADSEASLQISNTSLNQCNGHIADNNKRISDAAAQLETAKQQAAADKARADARWEASGRTVSALEASAHDKSLPACTVSKTARSALEGL